MSDSVFGTLLVPAEAREIERELKQTRGWRVVTFARVGAGFEIAFGGRTSYVDFAASAFPFLDAAAILFTDQTQSQATALVEAAGLPIRERQVAPSLTRDDFVWLDDLASGRFGDMLEELNHSQAEAAAMRIKIDEMRTSFALLEGYLHRHDVPPLRKIWHAPYRDGARLDVSVPFTATLPCSSWGLTRLQLWVVAAPGGPGQSLQVELEAADTHEVIGRWSMAPAQLDHRTGWVPFDLETSLSTYGQPLRLTVSGPGWTLGASAPWLAPDGTDGDVAIFAGPATRVYATLPGVRGPQGIPLPIDDRRRRWLLDKELATARALAKPAGLEFSPVSRNDRGLLVHPVAQCAIVATIDGAFPALAVAAHLSILHGHIDGEPFLVTLTPGREPDAPPGDVPPPRAEDAGIITEIGPVAAGSWVRVDASALARITFAIESSATARPLYIATRAADGEKCDLAWAIVTSLEFVLADG